MLLASSGAASLLSRFRPRPPSPTAAAAYELGGVRVNRSGNCIPSSAATAGILLPVLGKLAGGKAATYVTASLRLGGAHFVIPFQF